VALLFITCGVQGSGKTTLAKRLAGGHRAIRLTADEWLHDPYPDQSDDQLNERRAAVEQLQWGIAVEALKIGCNVVLDWGLWTREERDRYRREAQTLGVRMVLCVVDPPREELIRRLARRNTNTPTGAFHVTEDDLDKAMAFFERPTPEELNLFDKI